MKDHLVTADEDCVLWLIMQKIQFELIQRTSEYILIWKQWKPLNHQKPKKLEMETFP